MSENIGVTLSANMDVSQVLGAVGQIESSLKGLKIPDGIADNLKKNLERNLEVFFIFLLKIIGKIVKWN